MVACRCGGAHGTDVLRSMQSRTCTEGHLDSPEQSPRCEVTRRKPLGTNDALRGARRERAGVVANPIQMLGNLRFMKARRSFAGDSDQLPSCLSWHPRPNTRSSCGFIPRELKWEGTPHLRRLPLFHMLLGCTRRDWVPGSFVHRAGQGIACPDDRQGTGACGDADVRSGESAG